MFSRAFSVANVDESQLEHTLSVWKQRPPLMCRSCASAIELVPMLPMGRRPLD